MVLFSELCALGPRHEAETLPGPTEARLCALARETGLWLIPGPLFERVSTPEGDRVYFFDINGSGDGGVGQSIVI